MTGCENRRNPGDLVAIARNASLYDWLLDIARPPRLPVPSRLRADLDLPPEAEEPRWPNWQAHVFCTRSEGARG